MSDRLNSTPEVPVTASPSAQATSMANRIDSGMSRAKGWYQKGKDFAKRRPVLAGALALTALAGGSYYEFGGSSKGIPVASANLGTASASKVKSTGVIKEVDIVVGSYRKTEKNLILNNNADYKLATMTVVVDLVACPELNSINVRALKGQTIHAKGEYIEYNGKPEVKVTSAKNLTIDPEAVKIPASK